MAVRHLWRLFMIAQAAGACTAGDEDRSVCVPSGLEDVEEAEDDMMVQLQTRAVVDPPPDRGISRMQKGTTMKKVVVWDEDQESLKPKAHETLEHPVAAQAETSVPQHHSAAVASAAVASALASDASAVEVSTFTQWWARSLPFLQIAVLISMIFVLFAVHKLTKSCEKTEVDKLEDQFDASAKLQQLLRGMRFEPKQVQVRKIPTIAERWAAEAVKEGDSGNKADQIIGNDSEEEPEAEQEEPEAEAAVDTEVCAIAKQQAAQQVVAQQFAEQFVAQQVSADSPGKPAVQSAQNDKIVEAWPADLKIAANEADLKGRFTVQVVSC